MRRTFLDPSADPPRFVSVEVPLDASFTRRAGKWGKKGRQKRFRFDSHFEAIEGYLEFVGELLEGGHVELMPWLRYQKAGDHFEVRPPVTPALEVRQGGKRRVTSHDSLLEALQAFEELLTERIAQGYTFVTETPGEFFVPPEDVFEEHLVYESEDPEQLQKRYYQRLEEPHDEFGPEWWYKDGALWSYNLQLMTKRQGPSLELQGDGVLRAAWLSHEDKHHGAMVILGPDGTLENQIVYAGPAGKISFMSFEEEDGIILNTRAPGCDGEGPHGVWRKLGRDGELIYQREFDAGRKVGTWQELDEENRTLKVFGAPDTLTQITWERLDGTLEQHKEFDDQGRCVLLDFHDEQGQLTQRRWRRPEGGWDIERYHPNSAQPSEVGTLDEGELRHGEFTEYDVSGEVVETTYFEHGEEIVGASEEARHLLSIEAMEPIEALLACLEHVEYIPTPVPEEQFSKLYDTTSAASVNRSQTLEDHLARLHCIADEDLEQLRPEGAGDRGAWTHTSPGGSRLELRRRSGQLYEARVWRADDSLAAQASYGSSAPHVEVTLYHDDGITPHRWGGYEASHPWNDKAHLHCRRDGWWYDQDVQGHLRRAQYFSTASGNLIADHHYGDELYDVSDEHPKESFEELFGEARALAQKGPSRERFVELCRVIEAASTRDPERVTMELIPYLLEVLDEWPSRVRMAPWLWINRLILGALPVEALQLVSALSLTAAATGHYLSTPHYPLLLRWLETYPEDGPAPEGISLSFRDEVAEALQQTCEAEPHARYCPDGELDFDQTFHIDEWDLLLSSPLLREVRVLDLSWTPTRYDFWWDYQGILDGRGMTLAEVASNVPSRRLEVLDLWGQARETSSQLGRSLKDPHKILSSLRALNLGGGHPIGDAAARKLATRCTSLERLDLRPGEAGQLLDGYDFDEWEEGSGRDSIYGRIHEHWNVYSNDDIEKMRIRTRGWRALAKLPLERVTLGSVQADHVFGADVEVLSQYSSNQPRIAAWENHFEV